MSFTSLTFAAFCAITLLVYWLVRQKQLQNIVLLAAGLVFYGWVHPWYLVLLGLSTTLDYFLAIGMARVRERKQFYLYASLVSNLGVLAFFKYFNFFNTSLAARLGQLGINGDFFLLTIVLPAGLSFYSLKKLSYMLDISRGTFKPVSNFIDFSLYVSFFPQIVSGPIDRPQQLLPQIESVRRWKTGFFSSAWPLILMGFFKKVVIADTIKSMVDRVISLQQPSKLLVLAAAVGFTLQILADFSAYTDISRGVAWLFGFETSQNFRTPYLSLSPSEFWNRWHISLSNFLRDYIFFPLRRSLLRKRTLPAWLVTALPPLVTMLVSGLWHGAGWTFLIWGVYYGLLIVVYQAAGIQGDWKPTGWVRRALANLLMLSLIVFGWLIFRAPSVAWLGKVFFQFPWIGTPYDYVIFLVIVSMVIAYSLPLLVKLLIDRYFPENSWYHAVFFALLTVAVLLYTNSSNPDFIYFQF
jgi:alginate O-acetyltransferase complex protein AlgI